MTLSPEKEQPEEWQPASFLMLWARKKTIEKVVKELQLPVPAPA